MSVLLFSDVAGDAVIASDEGNGTLEYWNNNTGTWQGSPASEAHSKVTFITGAAWDAGSLPGTPFANMYIAEITSGNMGTKRRILLFPYSGGTIDGTPSQVVVVSNFAITEGDLHAQNLLSQGTGFDTATDSLDAVRAKLDLVPDDVNTKLEAVHDSGGTGEKWITATGFATPTDVTNEGTAIEIHGDANWTQAGANAGIVPATPNALEIPASGTVDYIIDARTYNTSGDAVDADAAPTITLQNAGGTRMESRMWSNAVQGIDSTPLAMFNIATGHYRVTYRADTLHTPEQILWQFDATITAVAYVANRQTVLSNSTAVDFTADDRAKLNTLHDVRITAGRADNLDNMTVVPLTAAQTETAVDAALDSTDGLEVGVTLRQGIRAAAAAGAGKVDAPTPGQAGTVDIYAVGNPGTKRLSAQVDAIGQRTTVTPTLN